MSFCSAPSILSVSSSRNARNTRQFVCWADRSNASGPSPLKNPFYPPDHTERATLGDALSRRSVLAAPAVFLTIFAGVESSQGALAQRRQVSRELQEAFTKALYAESLDEADQAWTDAIKLAPENSAIWSNRGTIRLQMMRWVDAKADFEKALELEMKDEQNVSGILLNNLGNAQGAVGDWSGAMDSYTKAQLDPDVEAIAKANYALAAFQVGSEEIAVREARTVLRRDPGFLDVRCALVAFLWGSGMESEAETEWQTLQDAEDGVGGELYGRNVALDRIAGRWPPRPTAALQAFLNVKRKGTAKDYNGEQVTFEFGDMPV